MGGCLTGQGLAPLPPSAYEPRHMDLLRGIGTIVKVVRLKQGSGVVPLVGFQVAAFGRGQGAKPPEASAFSKMR